MNAVMVIAHPNSESLTHAVAAAARRGLSQAGHDVTVFDLYQQGFAAAMSAEELAAYHSDRPLSHPLTAAAADAVRAADILVFVYPTWWSGLPAIVKAWLERVMVPGVGFVFNAEGKVRPGLGRLRHLVGISTYGSPWLYVKAVNDSGRRTLLRALRLSATWRCRRHWLAMYAIDRSTTAQRGAFLAKVEQKMTQL
jgi:NAD(P)H dehydrogenase (quinone)